MTRSLRTDGGAGLPAAVLAAALGELRRGIDGHPFPGHPARPTIGKSFSLFQLLKLICLST
jgi:hypothetical protein